MTQAKNRNLNYADIAKRMDDNGKISQIVEVLAEDNPIIQDAVVIESNGVSSHRTTTRTGLPDVYWRLMNRGVPSSKSTTEQVDETIGIIEANSVMDEEFYQLNGNKEEVRLSEDIAFLESINQQLVHGMFYANTKINPEQPLGLAIRYSDLSAKNAENIIDAGGVGVDNTSIWFIAWDESTFHLTYPKGQASGITQRNLGLSEIIDSDGNSYQGYKTNFKLKFGTALRDWRCVSRIANIDVSDLEGAGTNAYVGADLINMMITAYKKIKRKQNKVVIYCNTEVATALHKLAANKSNVQLTLKQYAGEEIPVFLGRPIRSIDALLNTEERVV